MKRAISVTMAILVFVLSNTLPAGAMGGFHGRSGFRRGSDGGAHHEFRGQPAISRRHESFEHHRFHRHVGTEVFIGSSVWWGPDWWWPPYPYYAGPPESPVVVQPQPQYYWYYCPNPPGYYPYVQQCPSPWLTVVPSTARTGQ